MKKDSHGIWEVTVKNAKEGDSYKYRILQATGEEVDKMDPYAFYSELRPNTASVISDLTYDQWTDEQWIKIVQRDLIRLSIFMKCTLVHGKKTVMIRKNLFST